MSTPKYTDDDLQQRWIDAHAQDFDPGAGAGEPDVDAEVGMPEPSPEAQAAVQRELSEAIAEAYEGPGGQTPPPPRAQAFDAEVAPSRGRMGRVGPPPGGARGGRPSEAQLRASAGGRGDPTEVALTLLGDMFLNRGHGGDRILKMYGYDKPTEDPLDREIRLAQLANARDPLKRQLSEADLALKRRQLEGGGMSPTEARLAEAEKRRGREHGIKYDPTHDQATAYREALNELLTTGEVSPDKLERLNNDSMRSLSTVIGQLGKIRRAPQEAEAAGIVAEEVQKKRGAVALKQEAVSIGMRARSAIRTDLARMGIKGKAEQDRWTSNIEAFERANKHLHVGEPQLYVEALNRRGAATVRKQIATTNRALDASDRLLELSDQYAKIPVLQRADQRALEIKGEYDKLKDEHQGIILQIAGSGSGSQEEREHVQKGIPNIATDPNMFARPVLVGIHNMLRLNADANMSVFGIEIKGGHGGDEHGTPTPRGSFVAPSGPPPADAAGGDGWEDL